MNTKPVTQYADVINGVIHIKLPDDFHATRVELTIVPLENNAELLTVF